MQVPETENILKVFFIKKTNIFFIIVLIEKKNKKNY